MTPAPRMQGEINQKRRSSAAVRTTWRWNLHRLRRQGGRSGVASRCHCRGLFRFDVTSRRRRRDPFQQEDRQRVTRRDELRHRSVVTAKKRPENPCRGFQKGKDAPNLHHRLPCGALALLPTSCSHKQTLRYRASHCATFNVINLAR